MIDDEFIKAAFFLSPSSFEQRLDMEMGEPELSLKFFF